MPIEEAAVRAVHAKVRALFKGAIKSGNKIYDLKRAEAAYADDAKAWQRKREKMETRNRNADLADKLIASMRDSQGRFDVPAYSYGWHVLTQGKGRVAGNCQEMAMAAACLVGAETGTAWFGHIGDPGDHAFCLVDDGKSAKPDFVRLFSTCKSGAWIIDPWANVCCPITEYEKVYRLKMMKWDEQMKLVYSSAGLGGEAKGMVAVRPTSLAYLQAFSGCRIGYREVKPPAAKSACVIL